MPSLPNVSLPSGLWSKMRSLYEQSPRLSTPRRTWRLSSAGAKRPRPSAATPQRNSTGRRASAFAQTASAAALSSSTSLDDYELLAVLGRGTFGVVRLARHRATGRAVAIKVLDRAEVVAMKQEVNILREQTVHLQLRHTFVSEIYATFQDRDAVYFVLEYCPGGEVFGLVYPQEGDEDELPDADPEPETSSSSCSSSSDEDDDSDHTNARVTPIQKTLRGVDNAGVQRGLRSAAFGGLRAPHVAFYAACVVSALAYLHDDRNVLYRDLKLENLVIAEDGYPKLIDFGLAKPEAGARARHRSTTLCGSAEYMAPEIVQRESYDVRADLWSLGVLLYELFFGATPFYHANAREQKRRICEDELVFPEGFEAQHAHAAALMRALLAKNPRARPTSCAALKQTPFFREFFPTAAAWRQLERKQLRAPFVPQLSGPFDTSLFPNAYDSDEEEDEAFAGY